MDNKEIKLRIIDAAMKAVEQLIKVAKEDIIKMDPEDELAADRLKNAAATKKFEILTRVESERASIEISERGPSKIDTKQGFAERRSK